MEILCYSDRATNIQLWVNHQSFGGLRFSLQQSFGPKHLKMAVKREVNWGIGNGKAQESPIPLSETN